MDKERMICQHLRVECHRWNSMNQVKRREAIEQIWKSKLNKSLVRSQACEIHIPEVHQPPFTPSTFTSRIYTTQLTTNRGPTCNWFVSWVKWQYADTWHNPWSFRRNVENGRQTYSCNKTALQLNVAGLNQCYVLNPPLLGKWCGHVSAFHMRVLYQPSHITERTALLERTI